ncbi:MAG: LysR family transcriptional regulator [Gemmataceae bacterium]
MFPYRCRQTHTPRIVKTAELGSFTGAADALGLTQVAVSRRIQVLKTY